MAIADPKSGHELPTVMASRNRMKKDIDWAKSHVERHRAGDLVDMIFGEDA